jgi:hypothetical protein
MFPMLTAAKKTGGAIVRYGDLLQVGAGLMPKTTKKEVITGSNSLLQGVFFVYQ